MRNLFFFFAVFSLCSTSTVSPAKNKLFFVAFSWFIFSSHSPLPRLFLSSLCRLLCCEPVRVVNKGDELWVKTEGLRIFSLICILTFFSFRISRVVCDRNLLESAIPPCRLYGLIFLFSLCWALCDKSFAVLHHNGELLRVCERGNHLHFFHAHSYDEWAEKWEKFDSLPLPAALSLVVVLGLTKAAAKPHENGNIKRAFLFTKNTLMNVISYLQWDTIALFPEWNINEVENMFFQQDSFALFHFSSLSSL